MYKKFRTKSSNVQNQSNVQKIQKQISLKSFHLIMYKNLYKKIIFFICLNAKRRKCDIA